MQSKFSKHNIRQDNNAQDYIFFHNASSLKSIPIMLASHQRILKNILKDTIKPNYFWIYQNIDKVSHIIAGLPLQIKESSSIFGNIEQLKQSLIVKKSQNKSRKLIIISNPEQQIQLLVLLRRKQIIGVVLFGLDQNNSIKPETQINEMSSFDDQPLDKYVQKCKDIKELIRFFDTNDWHLSQTQFFPNFVLLTQQVQKSAIQHRVMVAMINELAESQTTKQMINQLICVLQKLAKFHPKLQNKQQLFSKALNYLTKEERNRAQIVKMYTSEQLKVYLILNTFLRAMNCPTEIYYVQPLVKQLYLAVKEIQNQCFKEQINCYRGSFMTVQEFQRLYNAVGEIAQNLGFFSISLNKQLAESFKQNVLFEIQIQGWNPEQIREQSGGFACISRLSQYISEEEILFCPLSYFRVLQVSSRQENNDSTEFYVKLEYKRILSEGQNEQKQQIQRQLIGLHQQMQMQITCQSSALFRAQSQSLFNVCKIYFQFLQEKGRNLSKLVRKFYPKQKQEAVFLDFIALQGSEKQISKEDHLNYLQLLVKMGRIYLSFGRENEALKLFQQSEKLLAHWSTPLEQSYRYLKNYKAICLTNLCRFKEALKLHLQCAQTAKNIYFGQTNEKCDLKTEEIEKQGDEFKKIEQILRVAKQIAIKMYEKKQFRQINKRGFSNIYFTYDEYPIEYLNALVYLVEILLILGQQQNAFHIIQQCLATFKLLYRETHPYYIYAASQLIKTLIQLKRYQTSLELSNHYINKVKLVLGQRNFLYIQFLDSIGNSFLGLNKFSQALALFRHREVLVINFYGSQSPQHIFNLFKIGSSLANLGKYQQALQILQTSIKTAQNTFKSRYYLYLFCLSNIGVIYFKLRKYEKAFQTHEKCLSLTRDLFGQNHPKYIFRLLKLVEVLIFLNKFQQGYDLVKQYLRKGILLSQMNKKEIYVCLFLLSLCLGQFQSLIAALSKLTVSNIYECFCNPSQISLILYKIRRFPQSLILVKAFTRHIRRQPILFLQQRQRKQREIKDEKVKYKLFKRAKMEQKKHVRRPKCFFDLY